MSRRILRSVVGFIAVLALSHPVLGDEPRKSTTIEIDPNQEDSVAWLGYAADMAVWAIASGAVDKTPPGPLVPSFDVELNARRHMIVIWREMQQKEPKPSVYMDALSRIEAAGFLPEYVWTVHWRSSWKQQPAGLRIAEFYAWQRQELVGHQPRTGALVKIVLEDAKAPEPPASGAAASAAGR